MADQFQIIPYKVRSAGTDVPPEEVQAAINSLAQQTTVALNGVASDPTGPAGGDLGGNYPNPTVTGLHVTSGTESGVAITASTINSTPVGATTPSTGAFTTLTATTPVGAASGGTGQNTLSAHNVLLGEGTGGVGFAAPSTAGKVLVSQGAAVDPAFANNPAIIGGTVDSTPVGATTPSTGVFTTLRASSGLNSTAVGNTTPSTGVFTTLAATTPVGVASGGTGQGTLTAHGVLIGEGTAAVAATAVGTTGQALIGQTGADPVFGFPTGALIGIQVITSTQPYTPTAGTNSVIVEVQAASGGAAGSPATTSQVAAGSGAGAGAYAKVRFTTGFAGVTATIGAAGAAGGSGTAGGSASASSFGALISCPGGIAGGLSSAISVAGASVIGAAATAAPTISGGTTIVSVPGQGTLPAQAIVAGNQGVASAGGSSMLGTGGVNPNVITSAPVAGNGFGSGPSGAINTGTTAATVGLIGRPGVIIVYEYA